MATPKLPYEVIFTPETYDEKIFKLDHTFDLDKFHPPSAKEVKATKTAEHAKAGYTRFRPDARIEAFLKTDPPDAQPAPGKSSFEFWYEPFRVTFFLKDIEVYISSNYPVNSCPYRATYIHETEAHVRASLKVFLDYRDKLITALNGVASTLPRKDKRLTTSESNYKSFQDRLEKQVREIVKEHIGLLGRELKQESINQDSDYTSVYKQCTIEEWNGKTGS